ncbi:gp138.1 [Caviid betaherpesvirus 2]|uniref:Gp138.1 n=1 Tax=Guinea pig cytomegalovirus (strain 22122) TaxID=103920 RepID=L7ZA62_GPCMV|nr:gp138.1 [Caviid betaherpesvirus 2]AGE11590.1 gp138.1 [Caviid betaherpesvirus 2]AIL83975.1 gp138.1 [BAC cloning vector GPN13BACdenovo_preserved(MM)]
MEYMMLLLACSTIMHSLIMTLETSSELRGLYVNINDTVLLTCRSSSLQNRIRLYNVQLRGETLDVDSINRPTASPTADDRNYSLHKHSDYHELSVTFTFKIDYTGIYYCTENEMIKNVTWLIPLGMMTASTTMFNKTLWINCTILDETLKGIMQLVNERGESTTHDTFCNQTRSYIYNATRFTGTMYTCLYNLQQTGLAISYANVYLESNKMNTSSHPTESKIILSCNVLLSNPFLTHIYWDRDLYLNTTRSMKQDTGFYYNNCIYPYYQYGNKQHGLDVCRIRHFVHLDYFSDEMLQLQYYYDDYIITVNMRQLIDPEVWDVSTTLRIFNDVRRCGTYTCGICDDISCYVNRIDGHIHVTKDVILHPTNIEVKCSVPIPIPRHYKDMSFFTDVHIIPVPLGQNSTNMTLVRDEDLHISSFYNNISIVNNVFCKLSLGPYDITNVQRESSRTKLQPHTGSTSNWVTPLTVTMVGMFFAVMTGIYLLIHRRTIVCLPSRTENY